MNLHPYMAEQLTSTSSRRTDSTKRPLPLLAGATVLVASSVDALRRSLAAQPASSGTQSAVATEPARRRRRASTDRLAHAPRRTSAPALGRTYHAEPNVARSTAPGSVRATTQPPQPPPVIRAPYTPGRRAQRAAQLVDRAASSNRSRR